MNKILSVTLLCIFCCLCIFALYAGLVRYGFMHNIFLPESGSAITKKKKEFFLEANQNIDMQNKNILKKSFGDEESKTGQVVTINKTNFKP